MTASDRTVDARRSWPQIENRYHQLARPLYVAAAASRNVAGAVRCPGGGDVRGLKMPRADAEVMMGRCSSGGVADLPGAGLLPARAAAPENIVPTAQARDHEWDGHVTGRLVETPSRSRRLQEASGVGAVDQPVVVSRDR